MVPLRGLIALLIAAALAPLAGCIDDGPDLVDDDLGPSADELKAAAYARVKALMEGVPCEVDTVGTGTSENLKDLAATRFDDVIDGGAGTASLDFHGDIMVAATKGLAVLDISDPLDPVTLGIYTETAGFGDVKISPDGMTAVAGAGSRIELIDIRDPTEPTKVGEWQLGDAGRPNQGTLNAHMIYTELIADEQWVFVAANNNDGVWILKLTGPPEARGLEFVTSTLPVEGGPLGPHDMWVTFDEEADTWLLYSADGYHGWAVFDVSDPANPAFAGGHVRPETGYTHTIQAAWIDGTRIVVTIAEVGLNLMEVYDATDLMAPIPLGVWHVSEEGGLPQPAAPQHEFNIVDGKLYLGHYANGFYVFDLTTLPTDVPLVGTADLRPVAHYSVGDPGPASLFSDIWSVDVINGVLYASSMSDGVLVVGYGCNEPGDPALTSTG